VRRLRSLIARVVRRRRPRPPTSEATTLSAAAADPGDRPGRDVSTLPPGPRSPAEAPG